MHAFSVFCWVRCRFFAAWMNVSSSSAYKAQRLPTRYHPDQWNRCIYCSNIVELRFLDNPLLLFLSLTCFSDAGPNFWPQMIRSGSCLKFCEPPPGPHLSFTSFFHSTLWTSWIWSMNRINFDSASSLIRLSCNTSRFLCVVLVTSMYRSGIGDVSTFGTYRRTRGTTRWRYMWSPSIDEKSWRTSVIRHFVYWIRLVRTSLKVSTELFTS